MKHFTSQFPLSSSHLKALIGSSAHFTTLALKRLDDAQLEVLLLCTTLVQLCLTVPVIDPDAWKKFKQLPRLRSVVVFAPNTFPSHPFAFVKDVLDGEIVVKTWPTVV